MYSVCVNGKVLDYHYKKSKRSHLQSFYIGDILIGQVAKMTRGRWTAISWHTKCPYGNIDGFKTRFDASEFLLKVCGFVDT